jgi:hypothetical protein
MVQQGAVQISKVQRNLVACNIPRGCMEAQKGAALRRKL